VGGLVRETWGRELVLAVGGLRFEIGACNRWVGEACWKC